MAVRRLLTLHAPLGKLVSSAVLRTVEENLGRHGVKAWVSPEALPDVVLMADFPDDGIPEQGIPSVAEIIEQDAALRPPHLHSRGLLQAALVLAAVI
jgi:hypothetical protein